MRLREAYERLNFEPPVRHEMQMAARLAVAPGGPMVGVRNLGTSAKMLVELYLDLDRATRAAGFRDPGRVRFLVVCLNPAQGRYLLGWLRTIHEVLDLDVDLGRVTFYPHRQRAERLRGTNWPSWGIFCDHAVKEEEGYERPRGPYGLVRSAFQRGTNSWDAFGRDGNPVCRLTRAGVMALIDASTCPVTLHYDDGTPSVTFPGWRADGLAVRLVEAFKA